MATYLAGTNAFVKFTYEFARQKPEVLKKSLFHGLLTLGHY